jgi:hypothetical protein
LKDEPTERRAGAGEMRKRRTTLADGRYLIYYTFGEEAAGSRAGDEAASKRESIAEAIKEEERSV